MRRGSEAKVERRLRAQVLADQRAKRTDQEQIELLMKTRPGECERENARLQKRIRKGGA